MLYNLILRSFESTKILFLLQLHGEPNLEKGQIGILCSLCTIHSKSRHLQSLQFKRLYITYLLDKLRIS